MIKYGVGEMDFASIDTSGEKLATYTYGHVHLPGAKMCSFH